MPAADGEPPRRRARMDRAAMAPNWRQVLVVDATVGLIVVVVGLLVSVSISFDVGTVIALAGVAYLVGGLLRWRRWARLRAAAGIDDSGHDATAP